MGVQDGKVRLAPNLSSDPLAKALESVADKKILSFSNVAALFDKFNDMQAQLKWEKRLKHYTSVNCCLQEQPGWIW